MRKAGFIISGKVGYCDYSMEGLFLRHVVYQRENIFIQKIKERDDKRRKWVVYIL